MNTEVKDIEMLERAILTEARDEADQIKAEAQAKVEAIRKRAQEQAVAERKSILDNAQRDAVDEVTRKSLKQNTLDEISRELKAEFKLDALEDGTGIVVEAADGKLRYDNTLETRLDRLQGTLRSSVYKVLMGEKP